MADSRMGLDRKKIRLNADLYALPGTETFMTITCHGKRRVFLNRALLDDSIRCLREQADQDRIGIRAFCFMPDHLHMLARVDGDCGISNFMRNYKTRSTRVAWLHGVQGALWQRSYYDHIARTPNDSLKYLRYVLENPVRRGLVSQWREYVGSGSFTDSFEDDSLWDR